MKKLEQPLEGFLYNLVHFKEGGKDMKKYLIAFLFLAFVSGLNAQEFKFLGGPIFSSYSDFFLDSPWALDSSFNPIGDHKTGILGGFGIELELNKSLALEIDGLYFQKGSVFIENTLLFTSRKDVYDLTGLSFRVLAKIKPFPRPYPYFLGGGEFSLFLSHTRTIWFQGEAEATYKEIATEDLSSVTKKVDFGPVIGCGIEIKLSKGYLFLEGKYNFGLLNLNTKPFYVTKEIKTCSLIMLVGFKIKNRRGQTYTIDTFFFGSLDKANLSIV